MSGEALCNRAIWKLTPVDDRLWPRPCENALDEVAGSAESAAAAVTQRVEFLGEGPAPYAFIAAISGPAPRILIARFRL